MKKYKYWSMRLTPAVASDAILQLFKQQQRKEFFTKVFDL